MKGAGEAEAVPVDMNIDAWPQDRSEGAGGGGGGGGIDYRFLSRHLQAAEVGLSIARSISAITNPHMHTHQRPPPSFDRYRWRPATSRRGMFVSHTMT